MNGWKKITQWVIVSGRFFVLGNLGMAMPCVFYDKYAEAAFHVSIATFIMVNSWCYWED